MTSEVGGEPYSFHCVICYQLLHPVTRPPVILPCGHTHVCIECSKDLEKCMECTEPLTKTFKSSTPTLPPGQHRKVYQQEPVVVKGFQQRKASRPQYNSRSTLSFAPQMQFKGDTTTTDATPKTKTLEVPLPTPKNLVLISLIESMRCRYTEEGKEDSKQTDSIDGSGDDDELVVRDSMKFLNSSCGTYVVRAKEGLIVYDKPPKNNNDGKSIKKFVSRAPKQVKTLKYGQKVQILSFENCVATVARNAGFIPVKNMSQLVKGKVCAER